MDPPYIIMALAVAVVVVVDIMEAALVEVGPIQLPVVVVVVGHLILVVSLPVAQLLLRGPAMAL